MGTPKNTDGYATSVILRDFARRIPQENASRRRFVTGRQDYFQSVVDPRSGDVPERTRRERERSTDAVRLWLSQLNDREWTIIVGRFGLVEDKRTLRELEISKERVRQL